MGHSEAVAMRRRVSRIEILRTCILTLLMVFATMPAWAVGVDFRQAKNNDSTPAPGGVVWINSILQASNSLYYEGMVVPQRLILLDVPATPGDVHYLEFHVESTKGGTHAYDFLTGWDDVSATSMNIGGFATILNECGPNIGPPGDLHDICMALRSSFDYALNLPNDPSSDTTDGAYQPRINAFVAEYGTRAMNLYGNAAITDAQFIVPAGGTSIVSHQGADTGDSDTHYSLQWTSSATQIMIEFAGHLAVTGDPAINAMSWGVDQGASQINGGPYHFTLENMDGISLGAQDNQIKGADIMMPPPECSVTPNATICEGTLAALTVNGIGGTPPYTYRWEGPGGFTATTQTINVGIAGTYTGYVIDANQLESPGCATTLTVVPPPSAAAGADLEACDTTGPIALDATASNYAGLLWTTSGTGTFSSAVAEDPNYTPSAADIAAGSVTLTLTAAPNDGCLPDDDSLLVTFFVSPVVDAGVDLDACETTGPLQMAATASNYSSLLWTTSGTGLFSNAAIEDPLYTPSAADIAAGSVTLTLTAQPNDGCAPDNDSLLVTFFESPEVDAGVDLEACETTGPLQMAATASNYSSLLWTTSGTGTFSDTRIEDPLYTPSAADFAAGSVTLTLTAQPNDGCAPDSDSLLVTFFLSPISDAGPDQLLCNYEVVQLAGTATNDDGILWTTSGDGTFDDATLLTAIYTPGPGDIAAGTVTLTLTAYPLDGCEEAVDLIVVTLQPCEEFCSLTQGAYGNPNGQFWYEGMLLRRLELIQTLLMADPLVVGIEGVRSLTIAMPDAQCIITRLPAGSTAAALPAFGDRMLTLPSCDTTPSLVAKKGTKFSNVLLGQVIALSLNVRLDPELADAELCHYLSVMPALPGPDGELGTDDDIVDPAQMPQLYTVPESIVEALGPNPTVSDLLDLANSALAGGTLPEGVTLSRINMAVSAVNEAFDECAFVLGCTEELLLSTMVSLDPTTAALSLCPSVAVTSDDDSVETEAAGSRRAVTAVELTVPREILEALDMLTLPRTVAGLVRLESRVINDHWVIGPVTPEMIEKTVSEVHAAVDRAGYRWSCNMQ